MNYRQDIEFFRILSAFGIVWFHSHLKGGDIGYAGLVYFIALSPYLSENGRDFINRFKRLMIPWIIWFLFYGCNNFLTEKPIINTGNGLLAGILTGTHIHLWYLPFIFFSLVLFDFLKKFFSVKKIGYSAAIIAFISLVSVFFWREFTNSLGAPWAQYLHALPAVFIGAYLWSFDRISPKLRILILLLLCLAAIMNIKISGGVGIPYTIGILPFIPILLYPSRLNLNFDIRKISSLTLGIYLLHPFIMMIFMKFNINLDYYGPFIIFIISGILIWITQKLFPNLSRYFI